MSAIAQLPGIRVRTENENHHLWNNHGTWFLHYTVHPTPYTKERIRRSLGTKDVVVARERRDSFFEQLAVDATKLAVGARKQFAA
ncbi:MAG: integrase [Verrucomicrobia bacterium]|nr:integrase [Verrucomicrobiota bacterium]